MKAEETSLHQSAPVATADASIPRLPAHTFFGHVLNERFQLSDKVLGSGSFGHAILCYDYQSPHDRASQVDSHLTCIAKVETVPTESCLNPKETQLEHERAIYTHLHQYHKLRKYLPTIHLFVHHTVSLGVQVPVMVMERAGKDLLTILVDEDLPCYELRTLGRIGVQVVTALKYMHEMFVVHRDIKPQNIMLIVEGPTFQVKLIDFGLSMPIPEDQMDETQRARYRSSTCTLAFASWRQHFRHVCSARTDMESFMYSWLFLAGTRIPWSDAPHESDVGKLARREWIGRAKRSADAHELCARFDAMGRDPYGVRWSDLLIHAIGLEFAERPSYSKFIKYLTWLSNPPRL